MLRSELLFLEEELAEAKTDDKRISAVERFLIARMKNTEPDKLVMAALALIHKSKGNVWISELTDQPPYQPKSVGKKISTSRWNIPQKICINRST